MVSSSSKSLSNPPEPTPTKEVVAEEVKKTVENPLDLIANILQLDEYELKYVGGEWNIIKGTEFAVRLQNVFEYMFIHNCSRIEAIRAFIK